MHLHDSKQCTQTDFYSALGYNTLSIRLKYNNLRDLRAWKQEISILLHGYNNSRSLNPASIKK